MVTLPFLSKPKEKLNKFLAIDINSTDVKCMAFYDDGTGIKIIGTGQKHLEPGMVRAGVIIEPDYVADKLNSAIDEAVENSEENIDKVIIGVNGDLCLGLMTTVRSKRNKVKAVDSKEVAMLYNKLSEAAFLQAQEEYLQMTGNNSSPLEIITQSTIYNKIDGTDSKEILGKTASQIEMAVFSAFTPGFHIKSLQSVIKKTGLELLTIGSEIYGITKGILSSQKDAVDFIVLDINNDTTNAAVIFGTGILATRSLNIGVNQLTEGITEKMGVTATEAEKLLYSYISGKLTQSESAIIKACLQEVLDMWLTGLELLFSEFSGVKTFPSKIFIVGAGSEIPDLWNVITTEPWTKSIPFQITS